MTPRPGLSLSSRAARCAASWPARWSCRRRRQEEPRDHGGPRNRKGTSWRRNGSSPWSEPGADACLLAITCRHDSFIYLTPEFIPRNQLKTPPNSTSPALEIKHGFARFSSLEPSQTPRNTPDLAKIELPADRNQVGSNPWVAVGYLSSGGCSLPVLQSGVGKCFRFCSPFWRSSRIKRVDAVHADDDAGRRPSNVSSTRRVRPVGPASRHAICGVLTGGSGSGMV
jgi:hypothetical protein